MSSMFGSFTNWFQDNSKDSENNPNSEILTEDKDFIANSSDKENNPEDTHSQDGLNNLSNSLKIDEMSAKTLNAAKDIGTYFYSFGKLAANHVSKSAKQIKDSIEENTILGDFSKEQERFLNTKLEKKKQSEVAVPPWVGYNEEKEIRQQILALSHDKRNVLRCPPSGIEFTFDYESSFPVAMVMLEEDPDLNKLRFELVPKQVKEEVFWRNYFYRVSLIKQSTEISTMTTSHNSSLADKIPEDKYGSVEDAGEGVIEAEFASDAYLAATSPDEELHQAIKQLNNDIKFEETNEEISEWEQELQAELQEYEVVDEDNCDDVITDADLEKEILKELSSENAE